MLACPGCLTTSKTRFSRRKDQHATGVTRVLQDYACVSVLLGGLITVPAACAGFPAACGGHGGCREAAGGPRAAASERGHSGQPVPADLCHHSAQAGPGQTLPLCQPGRLCPHQAAVGYTHPADATSLACTATQNLRHHMQAMHKTLSDLVGADSSTSF